MFQIGDNVTINSEKFTKQDEEDIGFACEMKKCRGKTGTIQKINQHKNSIVGRKYCLEPTKETILIPGLGKITLTPRIST